MGRESSQFGGKVTIIGSRSTPPEMEERDSRVSPEDWDWEPISAMTRTKFGAPWRDPPPFAVLRIAAGTN